MAAAGGLLALNLWYFPVPPAEAGSVDLGPLTALWFIGLIVVDRQLKRMEVDSARGEASAPAEAGAMGLTEQAGT